MLHNPRDTFGDDPEMSIELSPWKTTSGVRRTERRTGCGKAASWLRIEVASRLVVRLFDAISST